MALDSTSPLRASLSLARPSMRLVLLRWLLLVVTAGPTLFVAFGGVLGFHARRPWFTEIDGPLPALHALHLLTTLPSTLAPAILVGVVLAAVFGVLLSAGAFALLAPVETLGHLPLPPKRGALAAAMRRGTHHLWPLARLVALTLGLNAIAVGVIAKISSMISRSIEAGGGAANTSELLVPVIGALAATVTVAAIGALAHSARALVVLDERKNVSKSLWLALRLLLRRPLSSLGVFVSATLFAQLTTGAALVLWRQSAPQSASALVVFLLVQAAAMLFAAWIWQVQHRLFASHWSDEAHADLRRCPDAPWSAWTKLRARLRRRPASAHSNEPPPER